VRQRGWPDGAAIDDDRAFSLDNYQHGCTYDDNRTTSTSTSTSAPADHYHHSADGNHGGTADHYHGPRADPDVPALRTSE
jgi:hypothetical protein